MDVNEKYQKILSEKRLRGEDTAVHFRPNRFQLNNSIIEKGEFNNRDNNNFRLSKAIIYGLFSLIFLLAISMVIAFFLDKDVESLAPYAISITSLVVALYSPISRQLS